MSKRVQVSITIAEGANLQHVADDLRARGLAVGTIMEELGIVQGEADESILDDLRGAPHVEALEQARTINLRPPGSPVQ